MRLSQRIALYARVSSDQPAQHDTIASQLAAVQAFATAQGVKIDPDLLFAANGISGTTLARPKLDALRDKAAAGEIDQLLILNPDRLARKYPHQLLLVEEFKKLGVEIPFANRQIATSPEDPLLLQMQGVIAEYEREKIVERHRRGKRHKAQQGKVCVLSGAPYGYVYIPATDTEEARYEIHEREAAVVQRVFHLLVEEPQSRGAIARLLTAERLPTRRDVGRWERSVIWAMLRNPAYTGQAAYRKTEVVERNRPTKQARARPFYPKHVHSSTRDRPMEDWIRIPVPALISDEVFQRAHERLEANKRFSPRNNKRDEYLLSGLLRCQQCGYALYGKPASNSKYNRLYYRCAGQDGHRWKDGRVCAAHPVRVEAIDELVWDQTRRLLEHPELVLQEYARRAQKKQRQHGEFKDLLAQKKREIKQQELEKERLLDLYQTGQVGLTEIEPRLKSLRARIKKLRDECALVEKEEKEEHHRLQLIEQFAEFTQRMNTNLSTLGFAERRQIVRLLVDDLVVLVDAYAQPAWLVTAVDKRLREELAKLHVQINEEKSRVVDLSQGESCGFLGFEFRRVRSLRGKWRPYYPPRLKQRTALVRKLKAIFRRFQSQPLDQVIELINPILRGWVNYFAIGDASRCFGFIKDWVEKKVRRHLMRARKLRGFGWKRWSRRWLYDALGLFNTYRVRRAGLGPKALPAR